MRALGASAMYGYQFYNMQLCARDNGWTPFVSMQDHYNLLYREDERELIPNCKQMGESLMPYSPLAAGHLTRRTWTADTLRKLGFDPDTIRRVSVCMYEGEINMVIHADGGTATVDIGLSDITITLADQGPGIPDIDQAMQAGYTTAGEVARDLGFGAGMGLPNMKKYSDEMDIQSTVGVGTTVTMVVKIPQ